MDLQKNYFIEKRKIKHARIRVSEDMSVRVLVPYDFSQRDIDNLLEKKKKWIRVHLSRFSQKKDIIKLHHNQILLFGNRYTYFYEPGLYHKTVLNHTHRTIQSKSDLLDPNVRLKWYRKYAKMFLSERILFHAKKHKLRYKKLFIRDQRTKWGNCSAEKNISLNWRLIMCPGHVIDYILIHELLHTRIMNHSQKFWIELKAFCPEYRMAIKWLEQYGNAL